MEHAHAPHALWLAIEADAGTEVLALSHDHVEAVIGCLMVEGSQRYGDLIGLTLPELLQAYRCRQAWRQYETPHCAWMQPAAPKS